MKAIKDFFRQHLARETAAETPEHRLQLTTAALLIEMARADFEFSEDERATITHAVQTTFELSSAETDELVQLAEAQARDATCLHEFTSLINKEYDYPDKLKIMEMLWRVAHTDAVVESHERHLMRKIASLLYISNKDYVATQRRASNNLLA